MSAQTQTDFAPSLARPVRKPLLARIAGWISRRDADYRAAHKLAQMPPERLRDMGLDALDRSPNRPADRLPVTITGQW